MEHSCDERAKERRERWTPSEAWNIFILFLSAYVIFALLFGFMEPANSELNRFLSYGDTLACFFFLADVFMRFMAAPNRVSFWKYAWIDVISSIPNFAPTRWGRLFQALRIIRGIRAIRATMRLSDYFFKERTKNAFAMIACVLFASIAISGMLVLQFEKKAQNPNITDASDALWWAVNTVTTVGGGNVYPVTQEGRIVAMLLMFAGISLFSSAAGIMASWFIKLDGTGNR